MPAPELGSSSGVRGLHAGSSEATAGSKWDDGYG